MTNPNNMVRVRARNGGRASVYEANGWAQAYTQGLLEGNGVLQNTVADMNVLVGGSATKPDVILAKNPAGYKVALDLVSQQVVTITAPASNKRISAIVAYTDDLSLATTEDSVTGSPASCGLIVVNGTAAANPTEPTDNQIRTAITSDGATGSQAAYCVVATILVENGTTAITNSEITIKKAGVRASNIDFSTFGDGNYSTTEQNTGFTWIDGKTIYKKTVNFGSLPNNDLKTVNHNISNMDEVVDFRGIAYRSGRGDYFQIGNAPNPQSGVEYSISITIDNTIISVQTGMDRTSLSAYITIWYTKTA